MHEPRLVSLFSAKLYNDALDVEEFTHGDGGWAQNSIISSVSEKGRGVPHAKPELGAGVLQKCLIR